MKLSARKSAGSSSAATNSLHEKVLAHTNLSSTLKAYVYKFNPKAPAPLNSTLLTRSVVVEIGGVMIKKLCHYRTLTYKYECVLPFQTVHRVGGFPLPLSKSQVQHHPLYQNPQSKGGYKVTLRKLSNKGGANKIPATTNHCMGNRVGQG